MIVDDSKRTWFLYFNSTPAIADRLFLVGLLARLDERATGSLIIRHIHSSIAIGPTTVTVSLKVFFLLQTVHLMVVLLPLMDFC